MKDSYETNLTGRALFLVFISQEKITDSHFWIF